MNLQLFKSSQQKWNSNIKKYQFGTWSSILAITRLRH
ncbi:unnamed protein product [Larinioides sclopetarius]|uniref:Uncharacterized protein n=1 Tax=Larinioides sclopetarius TaxID=280406 RepID=A0AAV2A4H2_9ARAC